jgi:Tol biopolymer transport system component
MVAAVLAAGVAPTAYVPAADAASAVPSVRLISRRFLDGRGGNGSSSWASISEDRRYVAFSSSASNLVPEGQDTNQRADVFVFDWTTATTTKITAGSHSSSYPAISPNGRFITFVSASPDLVPGDTNNRTDVFLYDRSDGSTKRVSVNSQGDQSNGHSDSPWVSSNGDVVFMSSASNLVSSDGNNFEDIFLHRVTTGVTTRISASTSGGAPNNYSGEPRITGNGNFVTYYSTASNLVSTDSNGRSDIFVWEANSGTTSLVSMPNGGGHANGDSYTPAISEDGRYVAFASLAGNLVSGDGNSYFDVFVRDRGAGVTTRVSVTTNGTSPNSSSSGRTGISQDGRYVTYSSGASNLVPGDTNLLSDVFVHDLQEGVTTRVSMTSGGEQIAATSSGQMLSPDGQFVVFETSARLVTDDQNGETDVYVYAHLGDPPSLIDLAPSAGAAVTTSSPMLTATYKDPNPGDGGHVEFEVYRDGSLVASNAAASPETLQPGETARWQVPAGALEGGRTYTWRARSFDGVNYSPWSSAEATRTLVIGGTYPTVDEWNADEDSGRVDYQFRVDAAGLDAPGEVAGPCYLSSCSWRVESRYSDGTVHKSFGAFASGTLESGASSLSQAVSGTMSVDATEIRTIIEPGSCPGCSQARTGYDSGWIKVRNPFRRGAISLKVNLLQRDVDSGVTTYDLEVRAGGAAKVGGPCHEKICQWRIEARHADGTTSYLSSDNLPGGTWSFSRSVTGTVLAQITDLKATLDSICGVNIEYFCSDQWEAYTTGWIQVSDYVYKDQDLAAAGVGLAPVLARKPTIFCERFVFRAGSHHFRSSLTDQYLACEAAVGAAGYTIFKVLESIIDAAGPAKVADFDVEPFPLPDPTVPPVRLDWEEETGCVQDIPRESLEAARTHIEGEHGYDNADPQDPEQDSYWGEDVPWEELVWPYAMRFKARPGEKPDSCVRVIPYEAVVGYERDYLAPLWQEAFHMTTTFTVVTTKGSGWLRTAHPGVPRESQ